MSLRVGLVGLPNVGKSTVFNALSAALSGRASAGGAKVSNYPFTTIEPNRAVVAIPDPRLARVAEIFGQERAVPAAIEFVDIAGLVRGASKGEGLGNQFLAEIREVDALLHIVRCFPDPDVAHVEHTLDPVRDVEIVNLELILADLGTVSRRQQKTQSALKSHTEAAAREADALARLAAHLDAGQPARTLEGVSDLLALLDLNLLTAKPEVYLANLGEDLPASEPCLVRLQLAASPVVPVTAKLEADLAELSEDERAVFVEELSLETTGLDRVIRACYEALDLVTFYTGAGAEARAWPVPRGTHLAAAAAKIHTDLERGFIKAEVVDFPSLDAAGSWQQAHHLGQVRTEGRDYVVKEGEVVWIRFKA